MENTRSKENSLKSKQNKQNSSNEEAKYMNVWEKDENSIFHIVTTDYEDMEEVEVRICLGTTVITEKIFNNRIEAIEYIRKKPWELIMNTVEMIVRELIKKEGEQ